MPPDNNPLSILKKMEPFLFEKAGWILFFFILVFIFWGLSLFYFNAWLAVNSVPMASEIELPLNQALWRKILSDVDQRRLIKAEPQSIKNIFR